MSGAASASADDAEEDLRGYNNHAGPAEPAQIAFHGGTIVTELVDGVPHVAMRPIVEHLGLDWSAQWRRIERHPVLRSSVAIMATVAAGDDRRREMMMLPAKMLSGWLFGVTVSKTRPELHDLLTAYQAECFDVLDAYWRQGVAVNPRVQVLPDDQPWIADQRSTPGQRFAEERARWERDEGRSMVDILGFTKPKLRSLEEFEGPLTKGDMLHKLTLLGFDIRYILGGERTLTDAERAIRDAYRLGDGADRKAIRQHAEAVRIVRTEARQALSSDSIDAIYAGADTVRYLRK